MSDFADELMEHARLLTEMQRAAFESGNRSGENARKLAQLCGALETIANATSCCDPATIKEMLVAAIAEAQR